MYVYINSEPRLYTVGFYAPDGKWHPDSDHSDREQAAKRVAWLNGEHPEHNQLYCIYYTEKGTPVLDATNNPAVVETILENNCLTHIETTVRSRNGEIVGRVWYDPSQSQNVWKWYFQEQ